jgi:hypothetical protein
MTSVGRRRVWSLVGGWLAVSCLLPRAELVEDDGSSVNGTGGQPTSSDGCGWNNNARCEEKACAKVCPEPSEDSSYCLGACTSVVDCVKSNPGCRTAGDPVCAGRNALGQENVCTKTWEMVGGTLDSTPATAARAFIECLCKN